MIWNKHDKLEGTHAFLSASKSSWLRKSEGALVDAYINSYAIQIGTLLHAYAKERIAYREKLRKSDFGSVRFELIRKRIPEFAINLDIIFPTLMSYVNDAIGFNMDPEIVLYYSDLCYGTADAIQLDGKLLRIHDLKTGVTDVKMDQLMIYAGLYFLEYGQKPEHIRTELRIYQNNEVSVLKPDAEQIRDTMDAIVASTKLLQKLR